jgi:hypothetical protein
VVDTLIDPNAERPCWGVGEGNAGVLVLGMLHKEERYLDRNFDERAIGIQSGSGFDSVDLDGEVLLDHKSDKGKPVGKR